MYHARCKRKSVIRPAVIYAFALCLSFAFPLPFLSAGDLWFSATITDMNIRIRVTIFLNIKLDTL